MILLQRQEQAVIRVHHVTSLCLLAGAATDDLTAASGAGRHAQGET